jgi:hypothetical protein
MVRVAAHAGDVVAHHDSMIHLPADATAIRTG